MHGRQVSHGEAQAVFEAAGNGGQMVLLHSPNRLGAPDPDHLGASIRPNPLWNGLHFCQDDWHVLLMGAIAGYPPLNDHDAKEVLQNLQIALTLDGNPLQTTQTAIKPFLNPQSRGLQRAWWFAEGQLQSPTDLSVGAHQLDVVEIDPSDPTNPYQNGITFFIDAAGTGVCL